MKSDIAKKDDSRWVHRVTKSESDYQQAKINPLSNEAKILNAIQHLITLRKNTKAFAGGKLKTINFGNPSVLGYKKFWSQHSVYVLANFSENDQAVAVGDTPIANGVWKNLITDKAVHIDAEISLAPYQFMWLHKN